MVAVLTDDSPVIGQDRQVDPALPTGDHQKRGAQQQASHHPAPPRSVEDHAGLPAVAVDRLDGLDGRVEAHARRLRQPDERHPAIREDHALRHAPRAAHPALVGQTKQVEDPGR